jgi:hypothetical protein
MNIYTIPLENNKLGFGRVTTVNKKTLYISVNYNKAGDFYSMNLLDSSKEVVVSGIRLIVGENLISGRISALKYVSAIYLQCSDSNRTLNPNLNTLIDYSLILVE